MSTGMNTHTLCANTYPNMHTHIQTDTSTQTCTHTENRHTYPKCTDTDTQRQTDRQTELGFILLVSLYSPEKLTGLEERFYTLGSVVIDIHTKLPHSDINKHILSQH